jgi:hypothetical protein
MLSHILHRSIQMWNCSVSWFIILWCIAADKILKWIWWRRTGLVGDRQGKRRISVRRKTVWVASVLWDDFYLAVKNTQPATSTQPEVNPNSHSTSFQIGNYESGSCVSWCRGLCVQCQIKVKSQLTYEPSLIPHVVMSWQYFGNVVLIYSEKEYFHLSLIRIVEVTTKCKNRILFP